MSLSQYSIVYSGGYYTGSVPSALTFASLGVTSAKFVATSVGEDYAEITVAVGVTTAGMPFVPLAKHGVYDAQGNYRFTGWLTVPGRQGDGKNQQQTFRLTGPSYLLENVVYKQPWSYPVDPTNFNSALAPILIAKVLLNLQDYTTGVRLDVRGQVQAILDYAKGQGAMFDYAGLANIPDCQPPEDEQVDMSCWTLLKRQLKWVPKVAMWWSYSADKPVLNFSANDAVNGETTGGTTFALGVGLIGTSGAGGGVVIDLNSGRIENFKSDPRYDLLISKVHVDFGTESDITSDGSATGTRKLWAVSSSDESVVDNGSPRELVISMDLRGAGGPRDPTTGARFTPQESAPTGLAAAIHDPFKQLSHSLSWSIVAQDVDWTTVPGLAVGVKNAGDSLLAGSRAIVTTMTREVANGTTTYEAGPPAQLSSDDIRALTRYNRTRNAGRSPGGGGGYNPGGGPYQKYTGQKPPTGGDGGTAGAFLWWNVAANGQPAFAQFISTTPVLLLPGGAYAQNPPTLP